MSDTVTTAAPRTIQSAREEFIRVMNEDTTGNERTRLLAVLDALIAWSKLRPGEIRFRENETKPWVISFEWVATRDLFWTAQPARGQAPRLSLVPRAAQLLSDAQRQSVVDTLNAHTRDQIVSGERLRIGFGALKNPTARDAVLALLEELIPHSGAKKGDGTEKPRRKTAVPASVTKGISVSS